MATNRKPTTKAKGKSSSKGKKIDEPLFSGRQITAILIFFIGLFLLLATMIRGVNLWNSIHVALLGIFGFLAIPVFMLMCYIAVLVSFNRFSGRVRYRVIGEGIFVFLLATVVNSLGVQLTGHYGDFLFNCYEKGVRGTGWLGGLLAFPFVKWFGTAGTAIILIILMAVVFLFTTGITLMHIVKAFEKPAEKVKQNTGDAIEKHKVRSAERAKEREQRRIEMQEAANELYDCRAGEPDEEVPDDEQKKAKSKVSSENKKKKVIDLYNGNEAEKVPESAEDLAEEVPLEAEQPVDNADGGEAPADNLDDIIRRVQNPDDKVPEKPLKITSVKKSEPTAAEEFESGISIAPEKPQEYRYPPLDLLENGDAPDNLNIGDELKQNAALLVDTLKSFGVETRIVDISRGPSVTRYELQPAAGVRINKITNLSDDIALNLAAVGVRIEAPIPGKAAVGIEIPNKTTTSVRLRELISTKKFQDADSRLTVAVGKDIAGNVITADLDKMPHLLIAGTTGSGKSVCINSFIISILFKSSPEEVKLLLIDPKVVELEVYNGLPHLLVPVVTEPKKASGALGWAVTEMEKRYKLFGECGVRNIKTYNTFCKTHEEFSPMPRILVVVDELNDLMMVAPGEVEDSICRLAQKARAAGINLVIATQRPSVDVITGLIKANIPSRIALKVANRFDSSTIIDSNGAEKLLGRGDMLFYPVGMAKPQRVQGCWVSDEEIKSVVDYITGEEKTCEYSEEISEEIDRHATEVGKSKKSSAASSDGEGGEDEDEMLPRAIEVVVEAGIASTSYLQRKLKLGYGRASRIIDCMEEKGIVGPFEGSKPRKVLISKQQWMEQRMGDSDE